jgi:NAD(P)-dependent dehydrogenase (short-subunit alcohol dehydrogenase family)
MNPEFDFSGKAIVITGATAGIGYRTALEFCRRGGTVIGIGRNERRCASAREKILQEVPKARISFLTADLSRQSEVRRLVGEIETTLKSLGFKELHVLVNNAGLFMDKLTLTEDGIETTIAVNHMAPFLLTHLLLPLLEKSPDSRVITVSSDSHLRTFIRPEHIRKPLIFVSLWQYKVSKLANVLFSLEFNRRRAGAAPHAFAVDPGLVNTDIGLKGTGPLSSFIWRKRQAMGVDTIEPATTILFLAGDADAPVSDAVYWHDSAPKTPARNAVDPNLAARLWRESARLCHIDDKMEAK